MTPEIVEKLLLDWKTGDLSRFVLFSKIIFNFLIKSWDIYTVIICKFPRRPHY